MVILTVVRLSLALRGRAAAARGPSRPAAALDLRSTKIGVSFTPGGLLYPYQLGAAKALVAAGVLTPATPVAGASSGGVLAVSVALAESGGPELDETLESAFRINDYCRARGGTGRANLGPALAAECDRILDATAADRLNARAAPVALAVTQILPRPRALLVSRFDDAADVKAAILATSCIPFYFDARPALPFRGGVAVDGVFAVRRRFFGAPDTGADATVRVCPFPAGPVGLRSDHVIAPDDGDADPVALAKVALAAPPAATDALRALFDRGRRDADRWLLRCAG